jgi:predicted DNA-binding protein
MTTDLSTLKPRRKGKKESHVHQFRLSAEATNILKRLAKHHGTTHRDIVETLLETNGKEYLKQVDTSKRRTT